MSYTPTNWKSGDVVTSAKLNKMEQGIASAGGANILVAHLINSSEDEEIHAPSRAAESAISAPTGTLDFTLEEIENADFTIVKFRFGDVNNTTYIESIYYDEDFNCYVLETTFFAPVFDGSLTFFATNSDDYPTTSAPEETVPPDVPSDGGGGR